ncbi:MAG: RHS repeat-associated core domain-containing protein, partial [Psychrosphaera sp.]|nr:RHS repeat-associated core domain-containing protein [Psychrosphaera sp.]
YCYDANGNQTQSKDTSSQAVKRSISYSAFNKPTRIVANGKLTTFDYDTEHNRYKRVDANANGSEATTTYYIGNVQVITKPDGSTQFKRYLGSYAIADSNGVGEQQLSYLHKGHLGSLDAVTNAAGLISERASFDAFGQRRAVDDLNIIVAVYSAPSLQGLLGITNRGFTGQEHIDSANLIHMNGRIYDPTLGRFVQADPVVQAPKNTQNLNRYSYVLNNPLAGTDPSGHTFILSKAIRWVFSKLSYSGGQIVAGIASMYCGPAVALCAAALSYENARAHGYNRGTAMQAGVYAGISAGVFQMIGSAYANTNMGCSSCYNEAGKMVSGMGSKALSHAVAGGIMSSLQGGKFGHGFFAAGATEALSPQIGRIYQGKGGIYRVARVMVAAAVGGTVSKLTGGKFGNGAVTGAFSRAFNAESHDEVDFTDELVDKRYSKEPMIEADIAVTVKSRAGVVTSTSIFSGQKTKSVNLVEIPTGIRNPLVNQDVIIGVTVDSNNRGVYDLQLQQSLSLGDFTLSHATVVDSDMKITEQVHFEYKNVGVQPKVSASAKPAVFNWGVMMERFDNAVMRCMSKGMCAL